MVSVRIVYSDCTETRSTYSSLRGNAIAMVRAVGACDEFQNRKHIPLATVTLRIDGLDHTLARARRKKPEETTGNNVARAMLIPIAQPNERPKR